jgi:transcriptional regulator with XRE-family HTH domain
MNKKEYVRSKRHIILTVGDSVRIARELQDFSQNDLAEITGIPQSTISGIENGKINLGVERAKVLAKALKVHPSVLLFPDWDVENAA